MNEVGTIYIYKSEDGVKMRITIDDPHGDYQKYQYLGSEGETFLEALQNLTSEAETIL